MVSLVVIMVLTLLETEKHLPQIFFDDNPHIPLVKHGNDMIERHPVGRHNISEVQC